MMIEPTSQLEEVLANAVEGMKFAVEGTELVTMYAEYAVKLRAAKDAVEVALPVEDSIQGPFGSARDQALARQKRLEQAFRFKRRLMLIARLSGSAVNLDQEIPRD